MINVAKLAEEIRSIADYNAEEYENVAKELIKNATHRIVLSDAELVDHIAKLQQIKSKARFEALAHSIAVSLANTDAVSKHVQGEFWTTHARLLLNLNLSELAHVAARKAISLLERAPSVNLATAYSLGARASRNLGNYPLAIESYIRSQRIAEEVGDEELAIWQVFRLGKMYVNYLYQPSRGVDYLTRARGGFLRLSSHNSLRGAAACLDQLGDVYRQTSGYLDRAEDYYKEALEINIPIDNKTGISRNYAHLGLCAQLRGSYRVAKELLLKAVQLTREVIGQERGTAIRLIQLGRIHVEDGDLDSARRCLDEAGILCERYREFRYMAKHVVCFGMLEKASKRYNTATAHFDNAVAISRRYLLFDVESDAYERLAEMYLVDLEDYMKAQQAMQAGSECRLKAWNHVASSSPNLAEIEDQSDLAIMYKSLFEKLLADSTNSFSESISITKKAYEIALRERDAKYNNVLRVAQASALVAGVKHEALNLVHRMVGDLDRVLSNPNINRALRNQLSRVQKELLMGLELLRGPMIQNLLSIDSLTQRTVSAKTVLAPILEWLGDDQKSDALSLVAFEDIPEVQIVMDPVILRLVLAEIVSNSREASSNSHGYRIVIKADVVESRLIIEVADNGLGMTMQQLHEVFRLGYTTKTGHTGIGLPTVKFLLESLGASLTIDSKLGRGTTVKISIPCKGG